jgi:hypothetical protein
MSALCIQRIKTAALTHLVMLLHLDYDRQNDWFGACLFLYESLEFDPHMLLQQGGVLPLIGSALHRFCNDELRGLDKSVRAIDAYQTTSHNFGRSLESTCFFVNGDDERDDAVVSELPSLAHRLRLNLLKARVVDEGPPDLALINNHGTLAVQLKHVAVLNQDDVLFCVSQMILDELLVAKEHSILAMNGYDELRTHGFGHDPNIFLRSVSADVNQASLLFDDVCAALIDVPDEARDGTLVSGNDARLKNDCIAFFDGQSFVRLSRHLREGRARLSLRARHEKDNL